jgi:hypothetical protein
MSFNIKLSSPRLFTSTLLPSLWFSNFCWTVPSLLDNGIKGVERNYVKDAVFDVRIAEQPDLEHFRVGSRGITHSNRS